MREDAILVNGKEFVGRVGFMYEVVAGKKIRVSKEYFDEQCNMEVMKTTKSSMVKQRDEVLNELDNNNNTKGYEMTYADKVEKYGVNTQWIKSKFGKYAYKPEWTSIDGKEMSGEFLVVHNGKPMMIRELTFKGQMHVQEMKNYKLLGMFTNWANVVTKLVHIDSFESRGRSNSKDDETDFDNLFDLALSQEKDIIDVVKFQLGDVELMGFANSNGQLFGVRPWAVYSAEQELRRKPKDLDSQFDDALAVEISKNELYKTQSFDEVTYTANTVGEPW